jgi:Uma2 family endonuclease
MRTKTRATIQDLYQVQGKAELINAEVVRFMPTGDEPARAGGAIYVALRLYERQHRTGLAYPDNVGYLVSLPHRESFSPHASFYIGERTGMRFLNGAPLFAAEVRSANDYGPAAEEAMEAKRADYFAAGTQVVWDVNLEQGEIRKFVSPNATEPERTFIRSESAEAAPALPGFVFPVTDLYE